MAIFDEISVQMKDALKARAEIRLRTLRSVRAAFLTEMKRDGAEHLSDDVCTALLRRLEKQRRESIEAFEQADRPEQAEAERAELGVIQEFLPSLADEDQTRAWVVEAIEATGALAPGDAGRVMGTVMKAHKGEVDGALARRMAGEILAEAEPETGD
jgi:hypothetical protein